MVQAHRRGPLPGTPRAHRNSETESELDLILTLATLAHRESFDATPRCVDNSAAPPRARIVVRPHRTAQLVGQPWRRGIRGLRACAWNCGPCRPQADGALRGLLPQSGITSSSWHPAW